MPKEIKNLKVFLGLFQASKPSKTSRREESKEEGVDKKKEKTSPRTVYKKKLLTKKNKNTTKFKLRTSRYLYTYKTNKPEVVKKIMSSVPSDVIKTDLDKKSKKSRKN